MADPAIRKVQNAIKTMAESISGITVFVDRDDDDPVPQSQRPAVEIRIVSVQFEFAPDGQWQDLHRALIRFDCMSGQSVGETIDYTNQKTVANIMAKIAADRTLGGMLQSFEAQAVSGSEADGADVGCAIFETEAVFFTPRGDFFTIVGQAGVHF